jgi:cytochrome c peroxidase
LPRTVATFKTPTLRDLADSHPYLHSGRMQTVEEVLRFYRKMSGLARAGKMRNADPELGNISIDAQDETALAAFLKSLTEDYETPLPEWKR